MLVKLEACWSGNDKHHTRVTLPCGSRYMVPTEDGYPSRKERSRILDLLERVEGIPRRKVRFI